MGWVVQVAGESKGKPFPIGSNGYPRDDTCNFSSNQGAIPNSARPGLPRPKWFPFPVFNPDRVTWQEQACRAI